MAGKIMPEHHRFALSLADKLQALEGVPFEVSSMCRGRRCVCECFGPGRHIRFGREHLDDTLKFGYDEGVAFFDLAVPVHRHVNATQPKIKGWCKPLDPYWVGINGLPAIWLVVLHEVAHAVLPIGRKWGRSHDKAFLQQFLALIDKYPFTRCAAWFFEGGAL